LLKRKKILSWIHLSQSPLYNSFSLLSLRHSRAKLGFLSSPYLFSSFPPSTASYTCSNQAFAPSFYRNDSKNICWMTDVGAILTLDIFLPFTFLFLLIPNDFLHL
jgi:hypothetical protein